MKNPKDCAGIADVRAAIDTIDEALIDLLARRMAYVDRVAEIKIAEGLPANVPARVAQVIEKVRTWADRDGFPADLAEKIWQSLIDWSIAHEERVMKAHNAKAGK